MIDSTFALDMDTAREALADPECPAIVLMAIVLAAYGSQIHGSEDDKDGAGNLMDPIHLWLLIKEDFGVETSVTVENRINAMRTAFETDEFFTDVHAFTAITKGLVDGDVDDFITGIFEELHPIEIVISMVAVASLRDDPPNFSASVIEKIDEIMHAGSPTGSFTEIEMGMHDYNTDVADWLRRLGVDPQHIVNHQNQAQAPAA